MNKAEAKRYAKRLVSGYIEQLFQARKVDPLVYDELCHRDAQGKRLSKADYERVCDEVIAIQEKLTGQGYPDVLSWERGQPQHSKPDGKPGPRWKGYDAWLRRQGRMT